MADKWLQKQIDGIGKNVKTHRPEWQGAHTPNGFEVKQVQVPRANPQFSFGYVAEPNRVEKPKGNY